MYHQDVGNILGGHSIYGIKKVLIKLAQILGWTTASSAPVLHVPEKNERPGWPCRLSSLDQVPPHGPLHEQLRSGFR